MANPNGTPVWFENNSQDRDKAADFYSQVVGWSVTTSPMPEHGGYLIASAPTGSVAGFMNSPHGFSGAPRWTVYFGCGDVDAEVARLTSLGGRVHFGPMDIPHVGRFAVVADPQGVVFSLMQGVSEQDSTAFKQGPNCLGHGVWIELATPDPEGAQAFYGQLFGWTKAGSMPMGAMGDYSFIGAGEGRPGAMMSSTTTGAPAHWSVYFSVADIDAALKAATEAGGRVLQGPDQIPGGEFSAKLADPSGAGFGVVGPRRAS